MYHIAVILTDARRKILWVNEDFTKITGYSYEEAVGKPPGTILQGPGSEPDAVERIRRGLNNMTPLKESITNYRKNGETYLCKLVIHPVFDDRHELVNFIAFEVDGDQVANEEQIPMLRLDKKYQSSSLRGLEELRLYGRLKILLEEEQPFLAPELSLKTLADRLDTNTKYLSQVVNHCSGH
ncbi:MAG: PAS domain-containing protein, partial [Lewinella sp.]|nr:PAS domain-containing protein [Lewinella sp.]